MRSLSLVALVVASAACTIRPPGPARLTLQVQADVHADVQASAQPVAKPVAVELSGAPVVEFFGVPLDGVQDVVFVLDRSGSMDDPASGRIAQLATQAASANGAPAPASAPTAPAAAPAATPAPANGPRKIDVAHEELVDALARLPAGTRMNVLFFNDELDAFAATLVSLDASDRDNVIGFVRDADADGRTALGPAMRTAFLMNARRIVLLSDGLGNVGGDSQAILRDAREAIRGGVRIDTIGLGSDQDRALLSALADESGGIYQPL